MDSLSGPARFRPEGVVNRGERPRLPLRNPVVREYTCGEFRPGEVLDNIMDELERTPSRDAESEFYLFSICSTVKRLLC